MAVSIGIDRAASQVLRDCMEPRIDAVVRAFGLVVAGPITLAVQEYADKYNHELLIRVPIRVREYVGG